MGNENTRSQDDLMGAPVEMSSVLDVNTPEEFIRNCLAVFGAGYARRIFEILDTAIGRGIPLVVSVSGPVTVSDQHRCWLNPLLETGWFMYLTTTDAVCYHDGHRALYPDGDSAIRKVAIEGHDLEYGKAGIVRVTDAGFDEQVLFDQDRMYTALLRQEEFQRKMTGTEFRNLMGKYLAAEEDKVGVRPGLLSTCWRNGIPVFVGAPSDGSVFLNSVKLWALAQAGVIKHEFELDLHKEVFEACAYHLWGLMQSDPKQIGILILGGGVPKNFSLQPEPTLSQIFLLDGIGGYDYDVQIVGAPVSDGSLTGCKPSEGHTWGKVSAEALAKTTESMQADYSIVMPLIAWALLDKRRRFQRMREEMGAEELYRTHPEARGFLNDRGQLRLFDRRDELMATLMARVTEQEQVIKLSRTWDHELALLARAK